jgi:hypothetical protein
MVTVCEFPGVRFYMDATEVVIVTSFPSGMPREMVRVGIHQFIQEGRKILAEKQQSVSI